MAQPIFFSATSLNRLSSYLSLDISESIYSHSKKQMRDVRGLRGENYQIQKSVRWIALEIKNLRVKEFCLIILRTRKFCHVTFLARWILRLDKHFHLENSWWLLIFDSMICLKNLNQNPHWISVELDQCIHFLLWRIHFTAAYSFPAFLELAHFHHKKKTMRDWGTSESAMIFL